MMTKKEPLWLLFAVPRPYKKPTAGFSTRRRYIPNYIFSTSFSGKLVRAAISVKDMPLFFILRATSYRPWVMPRVSPLA